MLIQTRNDPRTAQNDLTVDTQYEQSHQEILTLLIVSLNRLIYTC